MRKIEEIRNDIKDAGERLQVAKMNYQDIVNDSIEIGYDAKNHPMLEEYRKEIAKINEEMDVLSDEFHEAFYV